MIGKQEEVFSPPVPRKSIVVFVLAAVASLACATGCSKNEAVPTFAFETIAPTAEYLLQQPEPLPDFVGVVSPEPGEVISAEGVGALIIQGPLWEFGDEGIELDYHLLRETRILIDGQVVPVRVSASSEPAIEEDGQLSTRYYSPITFIVSPDVIAGLSEGTHLATIHTTSLSGTVYEYSWAFTVEN